MAHSLEIRVPLVDLELLRRVAPLLALKAPPTKQDMARTPDQPMPVEVLNRGKTGFSIPVSQWLAEAERSSGILPETRPAGLGSTGVSPSYRGGMKILHVIANLAPRYGGPAKACVEMAQAVARLGHEVQHLYHQPGRPRGTGGASGPAGLARWRGNPLLSHPAAPVLGRLPGPWPGPWAKKSKNMICVHIHSLYLFHDLVAGHYCRKYGVPYLIRPHGTLDPFIYRRHRWRKAIMEAWFENRNIRGAAAMLFTSEEEMRLARPYIGDTPGAVVPLGLDLREFQDLPEPGAVQGKVPGNRRQEDHPLPGPDKFQKRAGPAGPGPGPGGPPAAGRAPGGGRAG